MMGQYMLRWLRENHEGEYSIDGTLKEFLFWGTVYCKACDRELDSDSHRVKLHFESKQHAKNLLKARVV